MGTRADFYVGRGKKAEWIGSIAWGGYPEPHIKAKLLADCDEDAWRKRVADFIAKRDDGTKPSDGWPWPWDDSNTTDWAYTIDDGKVWCSCFGQPWLAIDDYVARTKEHARLVKLAEADGGEYPDDDWWDHLDLPKPSHPNMKSVANVTMGKRSGVILVGG
jgi:hypothetical protein